jgi:hypothetical protein
VRIVRRRAALAVVLCVLAPAVHGKVESVDLYERADVLGGQPFGDSGPYERLAGSIHFAFDPRNPANAKIVDLSRAPARADGRVGATADFMVLRPKDTLKGRGIALLEVSNRGGKAALSYFNRAARMSNAPDAPEDFGDGFLMRQGLTVIWVGWQFDVPYDPRLLRMQVPIANENGEPIYGLVRSDWVIDETTSTLSLGHRDHWAYPAALPDDARNVLTRRAGRDARRELVPRSSWQFARPLPGGDTVPDPTHIYAPQGFQSGYIYELVYVARDPRVVGLGLAAIRDTLSYAKHDETSLFPVEQGVGFGASQSGRFLRSFVYQGFNVDERGRKVFDGMLIHTAGAGRGSFNHRFAQPSRDAHRYSSFFYPTDLFPFTGREQRDPLSGAQDGLFASYKDAAELPKVMYTNTAYDYWGRAASAIHTTPDATEDIELLPNERLYVLGGGQHYVGAWPPSASDRVPGSAAYRGNPLDFRPTLRALLAHLVEWVAQDREPPASAYPTIRGHTLVPPEALAFPAIPGITRPRVVHTPYLSDYGPRWNAGIIDKEPPDIGAPYPVRVPQVDAIGNNVGGVPTLELRVPLATYTGWSLRSGLTNPGELTDFEGLFIPLPRSLTDATEAGDPRTPITTLYASRDDYLAQASAAAHSLVDQGYLLDEDLGAVADHAAALWDWVFQNAPAH